MNWRRTFSENSQDSGESGRFGAMRGSESAQIRTVVGSNALLIYLAFVFLAKIGRVLREIALARKLPLRATELK